MVIDDRSGGLLIPRPTEEAWPWSVAVWRQWGDQVRDFVLRAFAATEEVLPATPQDRCDAKLPVRLALIPEPENAYNSNAILVCPAPETPLAAPGPAIGYVREKYLYRNAPWIQRLDDLTDRPVVCHGWLELDNYLREEWDHTDWSAIENPLTRALTLTQMRDLGWVARGVRLDLPYVDEATRLVDEYEAAHPRVTGFASDEIGAGETAEQWRTWSRTTPDAGPLEARTTTVFGRSTTWLVTTTGVRLGRYEPRLGTALLLDERLRDQATTALRTHGITVSTPPNAPVDGFARGAVVVTGTAWEVYEVLDGHPADNLPMIGAFDPRSGTLAAWARPHLEPVAALLQRHGAQVRHVVWQPPPHDVRVHNQQVQPVPPTGVASRLRLLPALRHVLTDDEADILAITWGPAPALTQEEAHQVPVWSSLGPRGTCRLCGSPAFGSTPSSTFCDPCTHAAFAGRVRDTGIDGPWTAITIQALQQLAKLEFSGPPSPDQLHHLPTCPSAGVARAMLLRMLIPRPDSALPVVGAVRGTRTWDTWLTLAGLNIGATRTSRGTRSVATDGHACRSTFERSIDDFFHHRRIEHEPEPHYPWHPELNTTGLRADWRLADGTLVEALGMLGEPEYAAKAARKAVLAEQLGIDVVTVTPQEVPRLDELFARWLPPTSPQSGSGSPH